MTYLFEAANETQFAVDACNEEQAWDKANEHVASLGLGSPLYMLDDDEKDSDERT